MIVNFKLFNENFDDEEIPTMPVDFKIGDHVSPIKSTSRFPNRDIDLFSNQVYTIVDIYDNQNRNIKYEHSTNPTDSCDVIDKNNKIFKTWYLKRFRPAEIEYQADKYNI